MSNKLNIQSKSNSNNLETILVEAEMAINKIEQENQNKARTDIINEINKLKQNKKLNNKNNNIIKHEINNINTKLKQNDVVIKRADKSNSIIVISKEQYNNKVQTFINKNNWSKINKDPTTSYNNIIKKMIKTNNQIFTNPQTNRKLTTNNPKPPILNGLIKLHKPDKPIRPVINFKTAPSYKISKHLTNLLKDKIKLNNKHTIKNTIELTDKLQTIKITDNTKLYSFDITDMYSNIPITDTINIIEQTLNKNKESKKYITQLKNILKTITEQNYFTFEEHIYKIHDGLIMGSPISAIMSEIFLQNIDNKIQNIINKYDNKGHWFRYVDDGLCIINNNTNPDNILQELNKLHKNLKFTIETENNRTLNYLDLNLQIINNELTYSIYRKPTLCNQAINNKSNFPNQHKYAIFYSLIYRMLKIPLNTHNRNNERKIIHQMATEKGYNINTIHKIEQKIKRKIINKSITKLDNTEINTETKWTSITYINHNIHKISKVLNKYKIKTAYKTNKHTFNDQSTNHLNKCGVYEIKCPTCNKVYIGQTGKSLNIRYLEHKKAHIKPTIYKSNLALHCNNTKHTFPDTQHIKLIKSLEKGNKMDIWENLYIYKNHKNNKLIPEQAQTNTKHNNIFEILI